MQKFKNIVSHVFFLNNYVMKKLSINGTRNDILDIKVKVGSNKWRGKRLVFEIVSDLYLEFRQ